MKGRTFTSWKRRIWRKSLLASSFEITCLFGVDADAYWTSDHKNRQALQREQQLDNRRMGNWVLSLEWCFIDFRSPACQTIIDTKFSTLKQAENRKCFEKQASSGMERSFRLPKMFCSSESRSQNFSSVAPSPATCAEIEDVAFSSNVKFNEISESNQISCQK